MLKMKVIKNAAKLIFYMIFLGSFALIIIYCSSCAFKNSLNSNMNMKWIMFNEVQNKGYDIEEYESISITNYNGTNVLKYISIDFINGVPDVQAVDAYEIKFGSKYDALLMSIEKIYESKDTGSIDRNSYPAELILNAKDGTYRKSLAYFQIEGKPAMITNVDAVNEIGEVVCSLRKGDLTKGNIDNDEIIGSIEKDYYSLTHPILRAKAGLLIYMLTGNKKEKTLKDESSLAEVVSFVIKNEAPSDKNRKYVREGLIRIMESGELENVFLIVSAIEDAPLQNKKEYCKIINIGETIETVGRISKKDQEILKELTLNVLKRIGSKTEEKQKKEIN